jgi:hypothetical protein
MVLPGNHESECHSPACLLDSTYKHALQNFTAYNARFRMPFQESGGWRAHAPPSVPPTLCGAPSTVTRPCRVSDARPLTSWFECVDCVAFVCVFACQPAPA